MSRAEIVVLAFKPRAGAIVVALRRYPRRRVL
jgi:hypothetical protein